MVSDRDRRQLYSALEDQLGPGPAATLMELLPPVPWTELARQSDLVAVRGEISEVRGEISEVRGEIAEVRGEIAKLRAEVRGEIAEVRGEIAELRAEVRGGHAMLEAKMDGQVPRIIAANIMLLFAAISIVTAVAKLL